MMFRGWAASLMLLCASASAISMRVSLPEHLAQSMYRQQVEESLQDLYFSAGHDVQFLYVPQSRAFKMLKQHELDAIGYVSVEERVPDLGLIKVPEVLTEMQLFVACEIGADCDIDTQARFAVLRSSVTAMLKCEVEGLNCMPVKSHIDAQKALQDGLVNGYLLERSKHLEQRCFTHLGMTLRPINDSQTQVYHYMSGEYDGLAEALADKIRALKQAKEVMGGWSSCRSEIDWQHPIFL